MTVLTICQDALKEIGTFEVPSSLVSNTNPTATQVLALASRVGKELVRHKWTDLLKTYTFTTTNGTNSYALPSDFGKFSNLTFWDRTNYWEMVGPASKREWAYLQSGLVTASNRRWFRIAGKLFYIYPDVTVTGDTIAYDYYSKQWCEDSVGTDQDDWAADTDVPLLDEEMFKLGVKWRFLEAKGLPYEEAKAEFDRHRDDLMAQDGAASALHFANDRREKFGQLTNLPESDFGT